MAADDLGTRLRARRRELGLTLAVVAERAGLSLPYVANLERGRGNPTLEALTKIADALEVPLGWLVGDGGDEVTEVDLRAASWPKSLVEFSRSEHFNQQVERLAGEEGLPVEEMRQRLLAGMASAPRRSQGDPTRDDWVRLLDTYVLILRR